MRTHVHVRGREVALAFACLAAVSVGGAPLHVAAGPQVQRIATSPVADISFEMYRRWTIVPVQVEDSGPLRFIFDTGAPVTVMADAVLARTLPLQIVGQAQIGGAGDGPRLDVLLAGDVTLRVGNVAITAETMAVGLGSDAIAGTDGIVGSALLQRFVVDIDWQARRLRLYDPATWEPAADAAVLPLRRLPSGHLATLAHVRIDEAGEMAVDLVVDTGAGHALSLEASADLPLPGRRLQDVVLGWGANGELSGDIGRVNTLRLGEHALHGVVTTFPGNAPWSRLGGDARSTIRGNLGAQALQRFRVAFDVRSGRLALQPIERFDAVFPFDQVGMALRPFAPGVDFVEIADVIVGSPAAEAGVRAGDRLVAVQGRLVSAIAPDEILALFEGGSGDIVRIAWLRGTERFEADLRLRPLI